jgi:SAM-dependent methyltransferase
MNRDLEKIYEHRFSKEERSAKKALWQCLVDHGLQRYFGRDLSIIDIGCGLCEFINAVKGSRKYAYDLEGAFRACADPGVEFLEAEPGKPIPLPDRTCDRAFASNFFEHLASREEASFVLAEAFRVLKPGGHLVAIQPNIALVGGAYWDFFDHILPFTDKSLLEAMALAGFERHFVKRRFLPYTTKGKQLSGTLLLRVYLALPPLHLLFGKQSLIIARRPHE